MPASSRPTCVDCALVSPHVGEHAPIAPIAREIGWRVSRRLDHNGETHLDWRCPACADKARRSRAPGATSSGSFPAATPDRDKKKENQ